MIIAVPQQRIGEFWPGNGRPPYKAVITWHTWWCSSCGRHTKDGVLFSHAVSALQMGQHHADDNQCDVAGQLALFAVAQ